MSDAALLASDPAASAWVSANTGAGERLPASSHCNCEP